VTTEDNIMTIAQIFWLTIALTFTLCYAPGLRRDYTYPDPIQILLWSGTVVACLASFLGVR
jgi:hypothetical protein